MLLSPRSMVALGCLLMCSAGGCAFPWMPEQRTIDVRDPSQLPKAHIPDDPPPRTVSDPQPDAALRRLSLDEAIRIGLANTKAVRVLVGTAAVASGQTIYDAAISNTVIDQEQGRFDPVWSAENTWKHTETPTAVFDPTSPDGTTINGQTTQSFGLNTELSKTTVLGGKATLDFNDTAARSHPGPLPLNPQNEHTLDLGYRQPLLQGGGLAANLAPIVIARINTERSYFQLKDSVQESVRSVIEAYWSLVFARTDRWARQQQVQQGQAAYERAAARQRQGLGSAATVAQARLSLANFNANLIGAQANVIQREATLKNLLGLPPSAPTPAPITPPSANRLDVKWDEVVQLAEQRRPDLIELKLVLVADEQRRLVARNNALPKLDAVSVVGWNGLEGKTVMRTTKATGGDEFTDWTLGVNFSVPLGLRQGRAALRQQELIIMRDRANLDQGLHGALHELAASVRNLAQDHAQYEAFKEARVAARANLEQQAAEFRAGRTIFLNVLQAITDWGNAVSAEAQSLTQYNTELAVLERRTGTILETHGVEFFEERYASIGPLGIARHPKYPASQPPGPNADRYPTMAEPAENFFDLTGPKIPPSPPTPPTPEPPRAIPPPPKS